MKKIKTGRIELNKQYDYEDQLEQDAVKIAQKNGCKCFKMDKHFTHHPDQLFLIDTQRFFWVEFKLPNNHEQPGQSIVRKRLENLNHSCYVIDNIREFVEVLKKEINK